MKPRNLHSASVGIIALMIALVGPIVGSTETILTGDSGILVTGHGKNMYSVRTAVGDDYLGSTLTGKKKQVRPGKYVVYLDNATKARREITVESGITTLETGEINVNGKGKGTYNVRTVDGDKYMSSTWTGNPMDLFPGDYVVYLDVAPEVRLKVTVRAGQTTTALSTGTLVVAGDGKTRYVVRSTKGDAFLSDHIAGDSIELFPGNYTVVVGNVKHRVAITDGQTTSIR